MAAKIISCSTCQPPRIISSLSDHIKFDLNANKGTLTMKANVEISEGRFKTTAAVKTGKILLHPDWPLGMAARDIEAGEIIEFSNHKDTKDVIHRDNVYDILEAVANE